MEAHIERATDRTCTLTLSRVSLTELSRICAALNDYNSRAPGRQSTEEAEKVIGKALLIAMKIET